MSEKSKFQFKLGETVTNTLLSFTGAISARSETLTGCRRYLVGIKDKDGKVFEDWFGEPEIVFKKKAPKEFTDRYIEKDFEFGLGTEVEDLITKIRIVITTRSEYSPGFNRYSGLMTQPKEQKDADHLLHFDEGQLKSVGAGISEEVTTKLEAANTVSTRAQQAPAGPPRVEAV